MEMDITVKSISLLLRKSANQEWYANANEIAAFLASINPYWSQED